MSDSVMGGPGGARSGAHAHFNPRTRSTTTMPIPMRNALMPFNTSPALSFNAAGRGVSDFSTPPRGGGGGKLRVGSSNAYGSMVQSPTGAFPSLLGAAPWGSEVMSRLGGGPGGGIGSGGGLLPAHRPPKAVSSLTSLAAVHSGSSSASAPAALDAYANGASHIYREEDTPLLSQRPEGLLSEPDGEFPELAALEANFQVGA
jgi:hypothetical protein